MAKKLPDKIESCNVCPYLFREVVGIAILSYCALTNQVVYGADCLNYDCPLPDAEDD